MAGKSDNIFIDIPDSNCLYGKQKHYDKAQGSAEEPYRISLYVTALHLPDAPGDFLCDCGEHVHEAVDDMSVKPGYRG